MELSRFPNLYAKLTFIPTGSANQFPFTEMHDPCKRIIEAFGPDRCVWGSDFPTELWCPKTDYANHLDIFREEFGLTTVDQFAILSETADRLWVQSIG